MTPLYRVEFVKSAKKEFDALPDRLQEKIIDAARLLSANPFTDLLQRKKLKGAEDLYRIRLGEYRLVYEVRKKVLIVLVIKIGHRRDVYRGM